jgi:hypothetical protein
MLLLAGEHRFGIVDISRDSETAKNTKCFELDVARGENI